MDVRFPVGRLSASIISPVNAVRYNLGLGDRPH